jgi:hypothetical protein
LAYIRGNVKNNQQSMGNKVKTAQKLGEKFGKHLRIKNEQKTENITDFVS